LHRLGILLYISEVLSFIFGVRIWPRVKDDEVTIELCTHQVWEVMIAVLRAAAGQPVMPAPATMRSVVPAEPIEVVPAKDEVPARVVPGHGKVPAQGLPMATNSNLRSARPAEHVGVVVAALRRLGLTQDVPAQDIHALYPSFMVQAGIAPMSTKVFCEHLAKVCEHDRKRVGEIEDEASNTRKKMTVYTLPDESAAKVGFKPRPMGTIKAARARPRFKKALGTIGVQSPAIVSRGARMNGHSLPARRMGQPALSSARSNAVFEFGSRSDRADKICPRVYDSAAISRERLGGVARIKVGCAALLAQGGILPAT
jgi:hypothetical protein